MADVLFLGTGASIPSRTRSLPCVAVRQGSDIVLFDCGEGTQRQMMISPFSFMKISGIFITHLHGDHILGLPGLLQTMGMSGRKKEVVIGGPKGIRESVKNMLAACERIYVEKDPQDPAKELEFPLRIIEMEDSEVDFKGYTVGSFKTDHGTASIGFKFRESDRPGRFDRNKAVSLGLRPGKDFFEIQNGKTVRGVSPDEIVGPPRPGSAVVYTGDTAPCTDLDAAAADADLLIHESTYADSESGLAADHKHSTASDAARCALKCGVKALALIHISNRYEDPEKLRNEASAIFESTILAHDMMMLSVTEKGIRSV